MQQLLNQLYQFRPCHSYPSRPRGMVLRLSTLGFAILGGISLDPVSAQTETGRQVSPPFEIIYAGRGTAVEAAKGNAASVPTALTDSGSPEQASGTTSGSGTKPLPAQQVSRVHQLTTRLVAESRDAWMRGLMDQPSYAAWLDIAATAQLRIAQHQGDQSRVVQTLREHVVLWSEAAEQLERFNQPASHGWLADLTHARVMELRAKLRFSIAMGHGLSDQDQQVYAELVSQHQELRRQDYETGTGTAASVLSAASLVDERLVIPGKEESGTGDQPSTSVASFRIDRPVALKAAIDQIRQPVYLDAYPLAVATRDVADDGSAIDSASQFVRFLETPADNRRSQGFLTQLDQNAEEMSARQFASHRTGTATAGGMLQRWWMHESLAAAVMEGESDSTFQESQTGRLRQIHQLAVSMQDRRGRNSADVTAAETLWEFRQLNIEPFAGRQSNVAAATSNATPRRGSR
jgi:hypothetical protein